MNKTEEIKKEIEEGVGADDLPTEYERLYRNKTFNHLFEVKNTSGSGDQDLYLLNVHSELESNNTNSFNPYTG
jgi:hypothetical protein